MSTLHTRTTAVTPMAFVRAMAQGAQRRCMDPWPALEESGIGATALHRTNERITAPQMERMADQLMRSTNDEALGWFSRPLPWGSYGMLVRASLSAPTLGLALHRWCRHHNLLTQDVTFTVAKHENAGIGLISVSLNETAPGAWLEGELREFCHVSLFRNVLGVASWLVNSRISVHAVDFGFARPEHADVYRFLFDGPVRFGMTTSSLLLDARYMNLPVCRDEQSVTHMLKRALPLTVHNYRRDRLLISRVHQWLQAHMADPFTDAQKLADQLHMSVRTLHRQLKEEGSSFQHLKNETRMHRAAELLTRSTASVKKIAHATGFKSEKSFSRAFSAWSSGRSPIEFRSNHWKSDMGPGCP